MSPPEIVLKDKHFRLADIDLSKRMGKKEHEARMAELQKRLMTVQQAYLNTRDRAILVFEGWDAAGKGGTIRRMSAVLDPRSFKVWPIAAPTPAEQGRHYLYRFWERLPQPGEIALFDRSWYGRVLVERVEGLAPKEAWRRAYDEINAFERMLTDDGARVVKIFLHISADEQARRFLGRLRDPLKRWKLSYEDFRNRAKWPDYEAAIEEMVRRTSTENAPWRVIPAEDKDYARVKALDLIADRLSDGVDLSPRPLDEELLRQAEEQLGIARADVLRG